MFLSAVSSRSKPACSASSSNSPLESVSHPRSLASVTVWPVRWEDNGAGVLWSKSTSIGRGRGYRLDRNLLSIEAAGGKFQNLDYLVPLDVKPLRNLIDGGSGLEVFEHGGHGHPGIAKHPCAAESPRHAFNGGTLGPIESCHVLALLAFYHGSAGRSRPG